MTEWRKVRKKPVEVEAWGPWDGSNAAAAQLHRLVGQKVEHGNGLLVIHTMEGTMRASAGDYIIRGVKGELYPCKPDVFAETYEAASVVELPRHPKTCGPHEWVDVEVTVGETTMPVGVRRCKRCLILDD